MPNLRRFLIWRWSDIQRSTSRVTSFLYFLTLTSLSCEYVDDSALSIFQGGITVLLVLGIQAPASPNFNVESNLCIMAEQDFNSIMPKFVSYLKLTT